VTHRLQLYLLGAPQVILDGQPLAALTSAKAQALLFYLAFTGHTHTRAALASLLWGDVSDASARTNLRKALQALREHLAPWLSTSRDQIGFAADAAYWTDVREFKSALHDARDGDVDRLQHGLDLYRGDFLHGFYVRNAPDFETWWLSEEAELREQALDGYGKLADLFIERDELDRAIVAVRRSLVIEPWREKAHRRLMTLLAQNGQRSAALAQYEICQAMLADELGVEPGAETAELYRRILDGELVELVSSHRSSPRRYHRPAFLDSMAPTAVAAQERLVGRAGHLSRLDAILAAACSGHGQMAFVSGEAGWGKTSLLAEFVRRAQEDHPALIVVSGICTTATGAGDPYLPFRAMLQMLIAHVEQPWSTGAISQSHALRLWNFLPRVVEALVARGRHLVGSFLPGQTLLQQALAHDAIDRKLLEQVQSLTAQAQRQGDRGNQERIFEEIGDVVQTLASQQPLLLVVDDLHWADASSVNLLFHLARCLRQSPVLMVGAYRPEDLALERDNGKHPLIEPLNEFQRMFGDVWVRLDQIQPQEMRPFVDALIDLEPNRLDDGFRSALATHTGAHPLFTVEMLRTMRERGDLLLDDAGQWIAKSNLDWNTLPPRVEGVIETRIHRLGTELRGLLSVASVEGEIFTAQTIARAVNTDERNLVRMLDRDADARHRLIQEQGVRRVGDQRLSTYRFRHNLFQRYLYGQLSESEREFLHEDVGRALEQLYGDYASEIAVELAFHFESAGIPEKAIYYLHRAANQAIQLSAHETAIAHLTRGLHLLSHAPPSVDRSRQELALCAVLGRAQRYAGQVSSALETFQRVAALARELGAVEELAQAAIGFEETRWRYHLPAAPAVVLLQEALHALGEEESVLKVRVQGGLVMALMACGTPADLETMARQAVASARRLNDPLALFDTLRIYLFANRQPEKIVERVATADEMVRLAETTGNRNRVGEALGSRIHEHMEQGDICALDEDLALHAQVVDSLRQPFFQHTHVMFRAARMLLSGDFAQAEQLAEQALVFGQRLETGNVAGIYGLQMFTIRREQGRLREVAPLVKRFVEGTASSATWRPGLALIYSDLGMEQDARTEFEYLAADDFERLPWDALRPATLAYLSEVCAFLGDERRAATLYRLMKPYDGQNLVIGFAAACCGAVARFLGILAAVQADWSQAEMHFEDALTMNARMGAKPWLAHTQCHYAKALLFRGLQADIARCNVLLDEALATAQALGMHALSSRIQTMKRAATDHTM